MYLNPIDLNIFNFILNKINKYSNKFVFSYFCYLTNHVHL